MGSGMEVSHRTLCATGGSEDRHAPHTGGMQQLLGPSGSCTYSLVNQNYYQITKNGGLGPIRSPGTLTLASSFDPPTQDSRTRLQRQQENFGEP